MKNMLWLSSILACCAFLAPDANGSGAYIPGGGTRSESYNQGKALVTSQSQNSCKQCHSTYKRKTLQNLNQSVAALITDCSAHKPCFSDSLNNEQLDALTTYFKQRYRLR